jgi:UvrB/uvrC motif
MRFIDAPPRALYDVYMSFDITQLLEQWDYQPGQPSVRKFVGKDGLEKIQLRVDLGVLQMNAEGRPDGKRPLGHASLYEHYQAKLAKHLAAHPGNVPAFKLSPNDCVKLQLEAFQYHNRYNCQLQLKDYPAVVRDTERNLTVLDFVEKYAENEELSWSLQQFRPQLLMIQTRAMATQSLEAKEHNAAVKQIEDGIVRIREFYRNHDRSDLLESCGEITWLKNWLDQVLSVRPLSQRERLERDLNEAVSNEDYEKAAQVRDALRNLKTTE